MKYNTNLGLTTVAITGLLYHMMKVFIEIIFPNQRAIKNLSSVWLPWHLTVIAILTTPMDHVFKNETLNY